MSLLEDSNGVFFVAEDSPALLRRGSFSEVACRQCSHRPYQMAVARGSFLNGLRTEAFDISRTLHASFR